MVRGGYDNDDEKTTTGLALELVYNIQMRVGRQIRKDVGEEEWPVESVMKNKEDKDKRQ